MTELDKYFQNKLNTGLMTFVAFEELLLAKYSQAEQVDVDFWCPIQFYMEADQLVGFYDLEMYQGFIG